MTGKVFSDFVSKGLFPAFVYLLLFILLTFPLILNFSSHFFTDTGDGFTNIWNIWWINEAVTELHQSPWSTTFLHFPQGTSLLGHTLNPFNGYVGIGLQKVFSLTQTHNIMILFSFVIGGLTAFLLTFHLTRFYLGSLVAGFIFTFSNYHFSHAEGHMQLVSLEWIPLFLLCWLIFIEKPGIGVGLGGAGVLFLVILCDYYYFFYCVITAILITGWNILKKKDVFFLLRKKYILPLLAFLGGVFATSGVLATSLLIFSAKNPLLGAHHPKVFSLDLLAIFIPGGHWRFESLTRFYWTKLTGNFHENSVYIGLTLFFILSYSWIKRKNIRVPTLRLWYFLFLFFFVLSLGPVLHIWGKEVPWLKLPYALLEFIFPPLKMGGTPIRMMVMVTLSAGIIFAMGFKKLWADLSKKRWCLVLLLIFLCFEYLPRPLPETRVDVPEYVYALKELPGNKGVIDTVADPPPFALYYQTIHKKPIAEGYIARIPEAVALQNGRIMQLLHDGEYGSLYRFYHFQYLVTYKKMETSSLAPVRRVFDDGEIRIYDLGAAWE
ncbi:MAG: hypothetical protein MUP98_21300 [Candidatus Aminicenantes bacterium]|nr:hypothetical protein [Candidatus Aminicenantes bacterium]